ncbi:protein-arginine deiminase family protein [Labilithrix luteola]|nr:protein-arginine deiminase family protein [Labilithrix luteola]
MRRIDAVLLGALLVTACGASDDGQTASGKSKTDPSSAGSKILADIRADSNRDGKVSFDDESDGDKTTWNEKVGAVFLANIDDDEVACKMAKTDLDLPTCNDAADEVINGADDLLDLAPIKTKPWPNAPDDATATIAVDLPDPVRIFKRVGEGATDFEVLTEDPLTADEIRNGIELAIEAKDIVRDSDAWDGRVTVTFTVTTSEGEAKDSVKLRVSPVMTFHHLLQAQTVYVTNNASPGNAAMRKDLASACTEASLPTPIEVKTDDPWTQDFFETAYMAMPGANGEQHVINVNYRSANLYNPGNAKSPLRTAGRYAFELRGKDSAGIQQYDPKHSLEMDSLNSFGNTETIPPFTLGDKSYPLGRLLRGKVDNFYPDPTFTKMLESQGMQPPVYVDTSWLLVGHVDETLSFVKAKTPRGWVLLVNDASMAKKMLQDQVTAGHGDVPMFVGMEWYDDNGKASPAQATISEVLADTDVMTASAEAATEVDGQIAKIKAETGLTDDEIIHVPYLHHSYQGASVAYQPGTVNGIYVADDRFVAPAPHGPEIGGTDIFRQNLIDTLAKVGIKVDFAEDWDDYHAALGEVHCGSNTRRKIPDVKWWETGR